LLRKQLLNIIIQAPPSGQQRHHSSPSTQLVVLSSTTLRTSFIIMASGTESKTWNGNAMSQEDMMKKDTVLVLDDNDNVIGSAAKQTSHEFTTDQPRGILHRAFSVFLFDESTGELLLQQRASTKITFPNVSVVNSWWRSDFTTEHSDCFLHRVEKVWTNTCCSHPLHGMVPSEVDTPDDVINGTVLGAKNAAIRKLDHELGIPANQLPIEKFKFLTRLHYWAADTVTHGIER
jgi:isopentenyldiphosphate isomerase